MADMRLIDANALIKGFEDAGFGDHSLIESVLAAGVYAGIENAPTIDAVLVVHARWVKNTYNGRTCCSSCKVDLPGVWYYNGEDEDENYEEIDSTPYCPNCGAKMDGGDSNG